MRWIRLARSLPGLFGLGVGLLLGRTEAVAGDPVAETALGPLWQRFGLTLEAGTGVEAMGPFYYRYEGEEGTLWAVPPFVSSFVSEDGEKAQVFVLPPVFGYRRYGEDTRWQLGQWFNSSRVHLIDEKEMKRFNVFPIWFYQDAPDPARDYWALFPLYGTLQNRIFRDEAEFVAFPLWLKTRKGTMTTRNVLFPLIHWREGPGLRGWQFWPLLGHEHADPTTRTNLSDEVQVVPGHDKKFALWPMGFRNRLGIGTDNPVRVDAWLPLYYVERSPRRDHTSVLWPVVSWTDDREAKFRHWNLPWPLVGFAHGEGKTLRRVLPFFSVGHTATLDAETYAWPLYRRRHLHTEDFERERTQYGVFLYVDARESKPGTGRSTRRLDSWPLFSWTRDEEGKERLQVLSLVEPLRRGVGIERNWSPLWAVWRQERDRGAGRASQSLLWNLYRREVTPETTKGSLLFGAIRYQETSAGRQWRLFSPGRSRQSEPEPSADTTHVPEHR